MNNDSLIYEKKKHIIKVGDNMKQCKRYRIDFIFSQTDKDIKDILEELYTNEYLLNLNNFKRGAE